jgi:hypothetical protein
VEEMKAMICRKIIKTCGDGLLKLNLQDIQTRIGNLFPKGNEGILLYLNNSNTIVSERRARWQGEICIWGNSRDLGGQSAKLLIQTIFELSFSREIKRESPTE